MENYLYKTRATFISLDLLFYIVLNIFAWFIHYWLGIATLFFVVIQVVNIVFSRVYIYSDKIEYKVGLISSSEKIIPINKTCAITYSSGFLGKLFNFGDIIVGTYNALDGIRIKNVKNARMLCENIKSLISSSDK